MHDGVAVLWWTAPFSVITILLFFQMHQALTRAADQSITSPQVWSVCRTSSDVVERVINICSLCWLWIFFLPASSLGLGWLRGSEVCHSAMGSSAELYREGPHSELWESRPCCTPVLRDTQTPLIYIYFYSRIQHTFPLGFLCFHIFAVWAHV